VALADSVARVLATVHDAGPPVMPASLRMIGPGHLEWRSAEIAGGPLGRPT
jgi:hypothetical protein